VNFDTARKVADAVLYEGYILYPYRASAQKNRSRWQFGVVMPPCYTAVDPSEDDIVRAECVFEHDGAPVVHALVRFLQVQRRTPDTVSPGAAMPWDEAVEHEVSAQARTATLLGGGLAQGFIIPGGEECAPGQSVRRRHRLAGMISVSATPMPGPWRAARLRVEIRNRTLLDPAPRSRDEALPGALIAAHMIIGISGGAFVSMTDPPQWAADEVRSCENVGSWPVLAGPDGGRQVMLAAPIILYDYPQIAPESPGELFDGTEIDEILTLRTLALSDEEKREARATDPRAAALIDRVESLDGQDMGRLHGTMRSTDAPDVPWWDPVADAAVSPETDSVLIGGCRVARGSRVLLRPGIRRADAQDMFLVGRPAIVEAVLLDVADNPYLAVSLADDPDEDLRAAHGRYLYFAPDEVEPAGDGS
jgi:hypothetical protein